MGNKTAVYLKEDSTIALNAGDSCIILTEDEDIVMYIADADKSGMCNGAATAVTALGIKLADDTDDEWINGIIEETIGD